MHLIDIGNKNKIQCYAEIGVSKGETVLRVCEVLEPNSSLYIFDFEEKVDLVCEKINNAFPGKFKVCKFGNSYKTRDSYCWSLINLMRKDPGRKFFDYVYLDGSHDLVIDGLAFFLIDLMLKDRGCIEFDDYDWTFLRSPTVNPSRHPKTQEYYTEDQFSLPHIKLIVDHLVKANPHYKEIVHNRVYQKL